MLHISNLHELTYPRSFCKVSDNNPCQFNARSLRSNKPKTRISSFPLSLNAAQRKTIFKFPASHTMKIVLWQQLVRPMKITVQRFASLFFKPPTTCIKQKFARINCFCWRYFTQEGIYQSKTTSHNSQQPKFPPQTSSVSSAKKKKPDRVGVKLLKFTYNSFVILEHL